MAEGWSEAEVAATVADYFEMLGHEFRGEPYSKRDHNRRLRLLMPGRSAGAIEFKHANISALLIEQGFPYLEGYKPRSNYQERLRGEIAAHLVANAELLAAAAALVSAVAPLARSERAVSEILVPAPSRELRTNRIYDRPIAPSVPLLGVNYLQREAHNISLGNAGEAFVLDLEHRRLWEAGARHLADRIEHVSRTRGDGLGYDIASFDADGAERLIEVKTTGFGACTPFFASKREVSVSDERCEQFRLYRVFKFRAEPKVFVLTGSLRQSCVLDPVQYRATLG